MDAKPEAAEVADRADGLNKEHGAVCDQCVGLYRDGQFTAAMLAGASKLSAARAKAILDDLHAWGYVRCPVNDGGQMLYQMMPGVVHPKGA